MKKYIIYALVLILNYNLLPMVMIDTGSAIMMLLFLMPLICVITSMVFGYKHSFDFIYLLLVFILFIPSIFIYYHTFDVMIYPVIYVVVALIGMAIGYLFQKIKN